MMITKEFRLTFDELHNLVARCERCGAEKCFDLAVAEHRTRLHSGQRLRCDVCEAETGLFSQEVMDALHQICLAYERTLGICQLFTFRIPMSRDGQEL